MTGKKREKERHDGPLGSKNVSKTMIQGLTGSTSTQEKEKVECGRQGPTKSRLV